MYHIFIYLYLSFLVSMWISLIINNWYTKHDINLLYVCNNYKNIVFDLHIGTFYLSYYFNHCKYSRKEIILEGASWNTPRVNHAIIIVSNILTCFEIESCLAYAWLSPSPPRLPTWVDNNLRKAWRCLKFLARIWFDSISRVTEIGSHPFWPSERRST